MATPTYTPLATLTLASSASSVTFSSIDQSYGDLILVISANQGAIEGSSGAYINGDTGSNYSRVRAYANGSSTFSDASATRSDLGSISQNSPNQNGLSISHFMDYSATDKHKTVLTRTNDVDDQVGMFAYRWANTNAVTSIEVFSQTANDFVVGSTFSLYGVAK